MKKFMKALAVFAAMAMLAGSFVSCSSDDDSSGSNPAATKYTCTNCGTEYGTEAEKNNCAKKAGCPNYVAEPTKYKCDGCGTEYDTEAEKNACAKQEGCPNYVAAPAGVALPYSLDFKTVFASNVVEGNQEKPSTSGSYAAGKCFIVTDGTFDNDLIVIKSALTNSTSDAKKSSGIRVRTASDVIEASGLNYNGGTAAAFASTDVGATLAETLDRSVGVDTSKLDAAGSVTVTFSGKTVGSDSATAGVNGQIVLIDADSKILASKTDLGLRKDTAGEYKISATVTVGTKVILGFSRGGAGAGGLDVTEISVATAAE